MAIDLPDDLVKLQQSADEEGQRMAGLDGEDLDQQRRRWFAAAAEVQGAVTDWAREQGLNRYDVEKDLRRTVRHPQGDGS